MEIVDIINDKDEVIGQASRADSHADASLKHRTVHFTLFDPDSRRIMVSRRAYTKSHDAGKLCFLGEHVMSGEGYEAAVRRGAKEELGIDANTIHEVGKHVFSGPTFTEQVKMFLVDYRQNEQLQPDPDELGEITWHTLHQLEKLVTSEMTQYWITNVKWQNILA